MPTALLPSPAIWALCLVLLAVVGYVLYQVKSYRRLCCYRTRLGTLRLGQRQVYRRLEALGRHCEALAAQVPHAVRPAPYAQVDGQAVALRGALA